MSRRRRRTSRTPRSRVRESVRALVLSPDERVLLLQYKEHRAKPLVWLTPGGRREEGESEGDCLLRELEEETGHRPAQVGPLVWRRIRTWGRSGFSQLDHIYLVRTSAFEPTAERMGSGERSLFRGFRWWSLEELESSREVFIPRDFARHLGVLLASGPPDRPVDVGR